MELRHAGRPGTVAMALLCACAHATAAGAVRNAGGRFAKMARSSGLRVVAAPGPSGSPGVAGVGSLPPQVARKMDAIIAEDQVRSAMRIAEAASSPQARTARRAAGDAAAAATAAKATADEAVEESIKALAELEGLRQQVYGEMR
mmetsp:Transcript_26893/g.85167  ORF Transcript_26893/g.85167 Transcript_26893/m.85167 type:complete len:145 (+) Transcript_26893:38-472(+)